MSPVEVSAAELKKKLLEWAQAATEGYVVSCISIVMPGDLKN